MSIRLFSGRCALRPRCRSVAGSYRRLVSGQRPAPKDKYGPQSAYIAALAALHAYSPKRYEDAAQFFRRQVVNVMMGNTDAHLKNFSFIYPDGRYPRLSPAYDMVPVIA